MPDFIPMRGAKVTVTQFVAELVELNRDKNVIPIPKFKNLMRYVDVDPNDPSCVRGSIDWYNKGIHVLPDSIRFLTIKGRLNLGCNQLTSLPEGFGSLKVGGGLGLGYNRLASLPENFGSLTVGGDLDLSNNLLASLPEGVGSLTVGRHLDLHGNRLASLPPFLNVGGNVRY